MIDRMIYRGEYCAKPRMVRSDKWSKRDCVEKYWSFKDELLLQVKEQGYKPSGNLELIFRIKMPASWSAKKRAKYNETRHLSKPDIDNLIKAVLDCLFYNDSSVYSVKAIKYWAEESNIILSNTKGEK